MQLRDDKAHAFARPSMNRWNLGNWLSGYYCDNLRFVVQTETKSNKSRWKTCRFGTLFRGCGSLKTAVPKQQNSEETQQWLTGWRDFRYQKFFAQEELYFIRWTGKIEPM